MAIALTSLIFIGITRWGWWDRFQARRGKAPKGKGPAAGAAAGSSDCSAHHDDGTEKDLEAGILPVKEEGEKKTAAAAVATATATSAAAAAPAVVFAVQENHGIVVIEENDEEEEEDLKKVVSTTAEEVSALSSPPQTPEVEQPNATQKPTTNDAHTHDAK